MQEDMQTVGLREGDEGDMAVVSIPFWITRKSTTLKDRDFEELFCEKSVESKNNHPQISHVKT